MIEGAGRSASRCSASQTMDNYIARCRYALATSQDVPAPGRDSAGSLRAGRMASNSCPRVVRMLDAAARRVFSAPPEIIAGTEAGEARARTHQPEAVCYDPPMRIPAMPRPPAAFLAVLALTGVCCNTRPEPEVRAPHATLAPAAPVPTPAPPLEGQDFGAEARLLFRVAACTGSEPLPDNLDAAVVKAHCDWLEPKMESYRRSYLGVMGPFLAKLRPAALPRAVVYPFGGGDLLSALTSYPDATEITTISLESAGDPRRLRTLDKAQLQKRLGLLRASINQLLTLDDSAADSLIRIQRGDIPGQLAFFLIGLAVHAQEPVSLRYFRIEPDGSLHYLPEQDIAADQARAPKLDPIWNAPDFTEAFSNLELTFRARGETTQGLRIHRHIAANLANVPLENDPGLLRHLQQKGHVTGLIKAAQYLPWTDSFSTIRNYMLTNADFTFSDSSGIPPRHATQAGFVQETYGGFEGTFIPAGRKETEAFRELWKSQPHRDVPLRFGYADVKKSPHLLVTRRP